MEAQQRRSTMPARAVSSTVLGNSDLIRLILIRLDLPTDLVRSALVSKQWLAAASDQAFLRDFRARCPPRLLGFLAVFGHEPRCDGAVLPSSSSDDDSGDDDDAASEDEEEVMLDDDDDSDDVMSDADDVSRFVPLPRLPNFSGGAARLVAAAFNDGGGPLNLVKDCRNGRVLVIPSKSKYAVHRPLRRTASGAGDVTQLPAPPLPVEHIDEPDRYVAQHVLVQPGGDALTCVNSWELAYGKSSSVGVIYVELRVNILQDGAWVAHTSSGLQVQKPLDLYEFPYNLVVGNSLYMLTIVGYIGVFDLDAGNFSLVKLPDGVSCGEGGVLDHRLARAGDTGLYLVHAKGSQLRILHHLQATEDAGGVWEWELMDTIFLREVLGDILGMLLGEPTGVEIYAVGDDAEFVFLTVRDSRGVFLLDVKTREVENMLQTSPRNDGYLYRVFPFVMPWPPVFPALEEGHDN